MPLLKGDRIYVEKGTYKGMRGTFVEEAGEKSCRVKLEGDSQRERTIRLASVTRENVGRDQNAREEDTITIPRADYDQLLDDLEELGYQLRDMRLRVLEVARRR